MKQKSNCKPLYFLLYGFAAVFFVLAVQSCGKAGGASATGLNIEYEVFNLSPNLGRVNLYIKFNQVNNSFIFNNTPAYFFVPYTDTPYQFRQAIATSTAQGSGPTLFSRPDILKTGLKYSLFIFGTYNDKSSFGQILTVDTASPPALGRGKIRFVNLSPTSTAGLDVYANGTKLFSAATYTKVSKWVEVPVGNYDFQVETTGTTNVLQDIPAYTIQDGRLYTIYAHGYTNRTDSALFSAGLIINK